MTAPGREHDLSLHVKGLSILLRCACGWFHEWVAPVPWGWVGYEATRHVRETKVSR